MCGRGREGPGRVASFFPVPWQLHGLVHLPIKALPGCWERAPGTAQIRQLVSCCFPALGWSRKTLLVRVIQGERCHVWQPGGLVTGDVFLLQGLDLSHRDHGGVQVALSLCVSLTSQHNFSRAFDKVCVCESRDLWRPSLIILATGALCQLAMTF